MVDVFRKGKFELFDLTETMLKGNRDVSWYGLNGIIVQEIERTREGLVVLLNDVWHVAVIDLGCVSSKIP